MYRRFPVERETMLLTLSITGLFFTLITRGVLVESVITSVRFFQQTCSGAASAAATQTSKQGFRFAWTPSLLESIVFLAFSVWGSFVFVGPVFSTFLEHKRTIFFISVLMTVSKGEKNFWAWPRGGRLRCSKSGKLSPIFSVEFFSSLHYF